MHRDFGLAPILAPLSVDTFIREHFGKRTLHVPGDPDKLSGWIDMDLFERCVAGASRNDPGPSPIVERQLEHISANLPPGTTTAVVFPDQVRFLRELGANVTVPADRFVVELATILKRDLIFPGKVCAQWWGSSKSHGYRTHFDDWSLMVFQVEGSKEWRVQAEAVLEWPMTGAGGVGPDGSPVYGGSRNEWEYEDARPTRDGDFLSITMQPGDVLYVPAGAFHSTKTLSERSTALHFNFYALHLSEVIARFIEDSLMRNPAWRRPMVGRWSTFDGLMSSQTHAFIAERIAELTAALAQPSAPSEIFKASLKLAAKHEASGDSFQRYRRHAPPVVSPNDRLRIARTHPVTFARTSEVLEIYFADHEIAFDEPEARTFGEGLLAHAAGFWAHEAKRWGAVDTDAYLTTLLDLGVLERLDAATAGAHP